MSTESTDEQATHGGKRLGLEPDTKKPHQAAAECTSATLPAGSDHEGLSDAETIIYEPPVVCEPATHDEFPQLTCEKYTEKCGSMAKGPYKIKHMKRTAKDIYRPAVLHRQNWSET